jgi:hypothetical protein
MILVINEDHSTDTFILLPFRVCDSENAVLQVAEEGTDHSRFAVIMVNPNESFDFDGLPDSWVKDVNHEGVQFIFYDKRG